MPVSKRRKKTKKTTRPKSGNPRRLDNLPQAIDSSVPIVTEAFAMARELVPSTAQVLAASLPGYPPAGAHLDPIAAFTYLTAVRQDLEAQAYQLAQTYSAVQWLWYTRRITPEFFAGSLETTQFADHKVLEALSGLSSNADETAEYVDGRTIYPFSASDLVPVAGLASLAVALSRCHGWLRRAGKGTEFVVCETGLP